MKDIQVETWANFLQVMINQHDADPVFRLEKYVSSDLLKPDVVQTNYMLLRKNIIETEDSLFSTDQINYNATAFDLYLFKTSAGFATKENPNLVF